MPLSTGSRLGPYEIAAPIGAGGMGEVYKAKDTRLDRTVAVKVLPARLSASAESRQRFEREARTISQLSHAHICALYDVGREGDTEYLVMEYLEGETLAARLANGALPLDQTLRYGTQIADALDKAHRQGIVHRDLKPANVMLTKSGVKLLDFGLAKALPSPGGRGVGGEGITALPTQQGLTQEGTILGTFQYMAPEQLEGKEADARTDIFAFGALLYEMATGRKAFAGSSQASLISAIMKEDPPPVSTIQAMSPPALDRVVRTCLAKDPDDRWQSAHDIGNELKWIAEGSQAGVPVRVASQRKSRERLAWAIAAALAAALVASAAMNLRRPAVHRTPTRFSVVAPAGESFSRSMALSPDGRAMAFTTNANGSALWVHSFDSGVSRKLAGTEDARFPFWSPDGKTVGFFAGGKLKKIDVSGSPPQTLTEATDARGGTWGSDGTILFTPSATSGLFTVPSSGGAAVPATRLDPARQEESHRWPVFVKGGKGYLFLDMGNQETRGIHYATLGSSGSKKILPDVSRPEYAPGFVVFRREGALMAQRFDESRVELLGEPMALAETVRADAGITGLNVFSVSPSGTLAYRPGLTEPSVYVWCDRSGKELSTVAESESMAEPALSPDEKHVAWHRPDPQTGSDGMWLTDLTRNTTSRFTFNPANESSAVWSPDGARVAFASARNGEYQIFVKPASGATEETSLFKQDGTVYSDDWSADGRFVLYERNDPKTLYDLWVLPLAGGGKPMPYLVTPFNETHAQFSPDGKWVAYASDEGGRVEVYVQSFPPSGAKWQISHSGGDQPQWRRDGKELFYISLERKIMSVPLTTGATFEPGVARELFDAPVPSLGVSSDRNHYAVTADGQRFLIRRVIEEKGPSVMIVVLDWTAALPQP